jgi:hypothetical protein
MTNEEINKRVAVEVMGWREFPYLMDEGTVMYCAPDLPAHVSSIRPLLKYSTSIADAMMVVEKIGKAFKLERDRAGKWWGYVDDDRWYASGNEDTPSAAICLAALAWAEAQGEVKP